MTPNDESIRVTYYPLEAAVMNQKSNFSSSDYQLMADEIYDNKLKSSSGNGSSLLYYISSEGDLISFSSETLKCFKAHVGPIDSFAVTESGSVLVLTGKKLTVSSSSYELEIAGNDNGFKLLKAKTIQKDSKSTSVVLLLQSIGKLKDFNKEQSGERTAFGFYRIELKGSSSELISCDLLGWSLSRPSVVVIEDIEGLGDRIVLGTSSGIITEDTATLINVPTESPTISPGFTNLFNDEEEGDEESGLLNNCQLTEFTNSKASAERPPQFPEFTVSGVSVHEFHVPVKHLYDVNIYDFRSAKHVATFPAINFIQTGKIDKKFTVFCGKFALILETSGNIYCYTKPADSAKVSPQYLIQLEDEEIFGFAGDGKEEEDVLYLLTKEKIYRLELQ